MPGLQCFQPGSRGKLSFDPGVDPIGSEGISIGPRAAARRAGDSDSAIEQVVVDRFAPATIAERPREKLFISGPSPIFIVDYSINERVAMDRMSTDFARSVVSAILEAF